MGDEGRGDGRSDDKAGLAEAAPAGEGRRAFVALTVVGCGAIATVVTIPAVAFLASPLHGPYDAGGRRFVLGSIDELEVGVPKKASIIGDEHDGWTVAEKRRLGAVWLLKTGPREVRALSVTCPHLGCGIDVVTDARGDGQGFGCPCHDSTFDLKGERTGGPAPRGMDPMPARVTDTGAIEVTFVRYRIGIAAREEIGG